MSYVEQIINEAVQDTLNEAVVLGGEARNIEAAINILKGIYDRIIQKGVSRNEVSVTKFAKMIRDLTNIEHQWQNKAMW